MYQLWCGKGGEDFTSIRNTRAVPTDLFLLNSQQLLFFSQLTMVFCLFASLPGIVAEINPVICIGLIGVDQYGTESNQVVCGLLILVTFTLCRLTFLCVILCLDKSLIHTEWQLLSGCSATVTHSPSKEHGTVGPSNMTSWRHDLKRVRGTVWATWITSL